MILNEFTDDGKGLAVPHEVTDQCMLIVERIQSRRPKICMPVLLERCMPGLLKQFLQSPTSKAPTTNWKQRQQLINSLMINYLLLNWLMWMTSWEDFLRRERRSVVHTTRHTGGSILVCVDVLRTQHGSSVRYESHFIMRTKRLRSTICL